jgi:phenylalanyl-tRNA synthetase alpha chain
MIDLRKTKKKAIADLGKIKNQKELEDFRILYLGRKSGILTQVASELPKLSDIQKRKIGPDFNTFKKELTNLVEKKSKTLPTVAKPEMKKGQVETKGLPFDPSEPGSEAILGKSHPLTKIVEEVKSIFHYLGFSWVDGPEVESDLYNFQKLLIAKDHPSRDVQQTYYLDKDLLLRTHTSPMQIRYMEGHKPPLRIISPGRCYRRDMPDATHSPDFLQVEGLLVDEKSSLTDLIGVLDFFVKRMFGPKTRVRFYGHDFPYTEPSIEVEVYHKKQGWIEILGSGMVHPQVLENSNIDPAKYRGWAFGMGPNRLAMLKFGIDDIRNLYNGDLRFLEQF